MRATTSIAPPHHLALAWREELAALLIGAAFAFALFFGMARFGGDRTTAPAPEIDEIHRVSAPLEPPPPPPVLQPVERPTTDLPLAGIEIGASDSPVSIAVVPPDLTKLIPTTPYVPARVDLARLHEEFRPRQDIGVDVQRVYQQSEVDQRPQALVRATPSIPPDVQGRSAWLRVDLLLLIDQKGRVVKATVAETSGNPKFDAIVARCVTEQWLFSPAIRKGKKVKVLAQQPFRVQFGDGGSPFAL